MIPRALRSPVMAMARPARPAAEVAAVRVAAELVRVDTGLTAADPIAAIIAARVVETMQAYQAEGMDPFLAALGEARRKVAASPFDTLATDGDINTLDSFVTARMEKVRAREGRSLSPQEDQTECRAIWNDVRAKLHRRYLRVLRG